jgi:processive 1,2-diacylglycerol beta-glucosyltransferase
MHKVLILTAGFGNGHNTAAFNIREALETSSENVHVEVQDFFKNCYGKTNEMVKHGFLKTMETIPTVWGGVYWLLEHTPLIRYQARSLKKIRVALANMIRDQSPNCVVITYPMYNYILEDIYKDHRRKPFTTVTIVTDSISINRVWYEAGSDYFVVPNAPSAEILENGGVPRVKILDYGFPVAPRFGLLSAGAMEKTATADKRKVLYVINHGKKKAGRVIEDLMEIPNLELTITCGTDARLKAHLAERAKHYPGRMSVIGWTTQMPELLCSHDLVITKAGGAVVQESLAARCPTIINQVLPGQEAGNAKLVTLLDVGTVAADDREIVHWVRKAATHGSPVLARWNENLRRCSRPSAVITIAEFILKCCRLDEAGEDHSVPGTSGALPVRPQNGGGRTRAATKTLLCDFHTHTRYSDGSLSLPQLIDFYGTRGFDCLCVTDHISDTNYALGKVAGLSHLTLPSWQIEEYFDLLEREKKRAWRKYSMIVMAGLEFNKDGISQNSSCHLLGIDLVQPIDPCLTIKDLIGEIKTQGALAVASHPHQFQSHWGKNTLYLWNNQEEFAPLLDAWEIANRYDLFNPIGLKKLPFLANSDFHKPKHIYSWKTLLDCDKNPGAIKECVRKNVDISIALYRDCMATAPTGSSTDMDQLPIQPTLSDIFGPSPSLA